FALFEAYVSWGVLSIFPANLWHSDPLYIEEGRGLRVRSTFPHPILFGDALAMVIPMALYLLSTSKERPQRVILWMITLLMFWGLYKTSSRGPWLALGISCILLFFLVHNRIRKYLTLLALLTVLVLVTRPGIRQTLVDLYDSTQDSTSRLGSSFEYRHALIPAVTNALAKSPARMLLGYGLGTFREIGLDIHFLGITQRWHTCDNNWALFLYETGYLGLITVTILLFKPLLMTLQAYRRMPRPEKYFIAVIFISLASFYFDLMSVAGYNWGQQGYMAWILISLSVIYPRIAKRDRRNASRQKIPSAAPLAEPQPDLQQVQSVWSSTV
ncbi:MAG TPA: O-antigen ligase family protein, partial [Candidatus Acidoferrales bacterium]|nr:O-antigen ligase family protein [Candidatus Acidoferrales bacterium]